MFCVAFFMSLVYFFCFFFNDTATTEIYTLSLHDALPIWSWPRNRSAWRGSTSQAHTSRSEEHTSELQSHHDLVCRLLLEKKKKNTTHSMKNNKNQESTKHRNNIINQ